MKVDVTEWFDEKPKEYELSNDLYLATESDLWAFFNTRNKVLSAFMQEIIAMNNPDLLSFLLLLSLFRTTVYTSNMVFFKYPIRTILTLHITKSLCAIMLLVTTSNANSLVYPILSFASSHAFRHSSSVVPQ